MQYSYVACAEDGRIVKGKLSAASENAAEDLLTYGGYRLLKLKEVTPFFNAEKLTAQLSPIKPTEIIMFTRQLALLLESGTDIVTSLELLQAQSTNRTLKKIIGNVVSDIRGGSPLSDALGKHPRAFSTVYHRLVSVGEKSGGLETVLRRAADYMERIATTQKSVKNALMYPVILFIVAAAVVGILVAVVLPAFSGLYSSFGADMPATTMALIFVTDWLHSYGLFILAAIAVVIAAGFIYTRTPVGKFQWSNLMLTMPRIGRINLLNELSRCCRSMSLLYGSGLPLHEIMAMITQQTANKAMAKALTDVQQSMIAGAGLSGPMGRNKLFLPLMVQMTSVGEETGNLDNTLTTVAESYEIEADDKTKAMIALIVPAMTIILGLIVGFIAVSLVSAMYSIYGQMGV